jgi:Flp pilus assembly protein CpaB
MESVHKLFSTRGGTMALAGLAALIAAIAVFAYVRHYRDTVSQGATPATVLVAKSLIPKGTPGSEVATKELFQAESIRESQLRTGAISDTASLRGMVAKTDILPRQQLTVADFTSTASGIAGQLSGDQRAITIPVDTAHGMIGEIASGNRVDVYAGFDVSPVDSLGRPLSTTGQSRPVLRLIMQNVAVLAVNKSNQFGGANTSNVTLRTTAYQAEQLAFATDNGKLWLVLRPPSGASPSPPSLMTVETLLLGVSPVTELHSFTGGSR